MHLFLAILFGYLLGSVPFGLLLSKLKGRDPRKIGSGNIGATNVVRTAGIWFGITTLAADILKGYVPVALAIYYGQPPVIVALLGMALFVGHLFPIYLKFKGGKGVATALGVFLALGPIATLLAVGVFFVVTIICRYVSLGSLFCIGVIPPLFLYFRTPSPYIYFSVIVVFLVFIKHWGNIERLRTGTESKFSFRSRSGKEA
jgi:acyl phosphate:glycerol-3-phosphate acyltransferase